MTREQRLEAALIEARRLLDHFGYAAESMTLAHRHSPCKVFVGLKDETHLRVGYFRRAKELTVEIDLLLKHQRV